MSLEYLEYFPGHSKYSVNTGFRVSGSTVETVYSMSLFHGTLKFIECCSVLGCVLGDESKVVSKRDHVLRQLTA